MFTARKNVLGHMQQGGYPSPFDRNMATKMALKAYRWIKEQVESNIKGDGTMMADKKTSAVLLGMRTWHSVVSSSVL